MKIVLVAGARPNFMKIAPIFKAIRAHNNNQPGQLIEPLLVHTGQHYDYEMSKVFFEDLDLANPDIYLGVGSGGHGEQTGKVLIEFEKVLLQQKPDIVLVVGDVNSTLAAALASVKLHIPVAHVEAGVRTGDMAMPEEVNRLLTDHISEFLFTTSHYDDEDLRKEGIPESRIFMVGNVMVDSLMEHKEKAMKRLILAQLGLTGNNYVLVTLHRPANVDEKDRLLNLLGLIAVISHDFKVVFPVHPRTQKMMKQHGVWDTVEKESGNILMLNPLGYLDFVNLQVNAKAVITDSGGIQVETAILGIPCFTLMDKPVWKITHDAGANVLVGSRGDILIDEFGKLCGEEWKMPKPPEMWDGMTAQRIIDCMLEHPR